MVLSSCQLCKSPIYKRSDGRPVCGQVTVRAHICCTRAQHGGYLQQHIERCHSNNRHSKSKINESSIYSPFISLENDASEAQNISLIHPIVNNNDTQNNANDSINHCMKDVHLPINQPIELASKHLTEHDDAIPIFSLQRSNQTTFNHHDKFIDLSNGDVDDLSTSRSALIVTPHRKRKQHLIDFDCLHATQKNTRRNVVRPQVLQVLQSGGLPVEEAFPRKQLQEEQLIHFCERERDICRSLKLYQTPAEDTMQKCFGRLVEKYSTGTATFDEPAHQSAKKNGAFMTDPLRFIRLLRKDSKTPFLAIGADCSAGLTKIGATFLYGGVSTFACLAVYEGQDHWDDLVCFNDTKLTPMTGESGGYHTFYWSAIQQILDDGSFMNGDWSFLNSVLGLMAPSATFPCPICLVRLGKLFEPAPSRSTDVNRAFSHDPDHIPLLTIDPSRIVPTPLHIMLGVSNKLIMEVFTEMFGSEAAEAAIKSVKTVHTKGCGGRASFKALIGPEIVRFLAKSDCFFTNISTHDSERYDTMIQWMKQMQFFLLSVSQWDEADVAVWRQCVAAIQSRWTELTARKPFQKLHMLTHTVEFAEKHRFLSSLSESQLESYHRGFNVVFNQRNLNKSHEPSERIRRSMVQLLLVQIQPLILRDMNLEPIFQTTETKRLEQARKASM